MNINEYITIYVNIVIIYIRCNGCPESLSVQVIVVGALVGGYGGHSSGGMLFLSLTYNNNVETGRTAIDYGENYYTAMSTAPLER